MTDPPPARRVSIRRRLLLLVAAFVAVLIGFGLFQSRSGGSRGELDRFLAELDEREPGWRLEELEAAREEMPEERNSARVVTSVAKRMPGNWPNFEAITPPEGTPANVRLDDARLARLHAELDAVAALRPEAWLLRTLPRGRHRLALDLNNPYMIPLDDQQGTRRVASLLSLDSLKLAHAGEVGAAIRSAHAGVNASRSLGDEPINFSQQIRISCFLSAADAVERALALGESDDGPLAELQELLVDDEKYNGYLILLRGERAMIHLGLTNLANGKMKPADLIGGELTPAFQFRIRMMPWSVRKSARDDQMTLLKLKTRAIENARRPIHEQHADEAVLKAEMAKVANQSDLARALMFGRQRFGEYHVRKTALNRCLLAAVAAERYRLRHKSWPDSLDALKPDLLKEVPLDPYDGKPLRYKKLPDVVVYSVGPDLSDDGGKVDRVRPLTPGTDLGYRLWDAAWRNRPVGVPCAKP